MVFVTMLVAFALLFLISLYVPVVDYIAAGLFIVILFAILRALWRALLRPGAHRRTRRGRRRHTIWL